MTSGRDIRNLGGRPATGVGTPVTVRLQPEPLAALDAWISDLGEPAPSRPEAVRQILAEHLRTAGYLGGEVAEPTGAALEEPTPDRYADADPDEGVMVTGVGPMTLRRAVRKLADWREHHGLGLINIYRGANKRPGIFDEEDLGRLGGMERFR